MLPSIAERRPEIAALCRRYGVRRLDVFGSAARGADFEPQRSDVDFVVAFASADGVSLDKFLALREPLSATVGRPVDHVMNGSIRNPCIRAGIERSAEIVYGPWPARLSVGCKTERECDCGVRQRRTVADYLTDRTLRAAVERQFEIIGEALRQLE
jgi:uncharacterized protein